MESKKRLMALAIAVCMICNKEGSSVSAAESIALEVTAEESAGIETEGTDVQESSMENPSESPEESFMENSTEIPEEDFMENSSESSITLEETSVSENSETGSSISEETSDVGESDMPETDADMESEVPSGTETEEYLTDEELLTETQTEENIVEYPNAEIPFEIGGEDITAGVGNVYNQGNYPAKYDLRAKMTPVKTQGKWGLCWAFATMAALEHSLIRNNLAGVGIDLSERHLGYFAFNSGSDVLGNAGNDSIKSSPSDTYLNRGGNTYEAITRLMNWQGAASEGAYPYNATSQMAALPSSEAQKNRKAIMHDAYFIPTRNADREEKINTIKSLIMEYGALEWSYGHDNSYYNSKTAAYYCPYRGTNHAITIVGWDDNFSKTNFKSGRQPANNGAWIVKNSWGASFGDKGYIYISYDDASLGSSNPATAFVAANPDQYDNNYFYGNTVNYNTNRCKKAALVFNAAGTAPYEQLEAVSMMLYSDKVEYSIQIYKNPLLTDGVVKDPESGQPMLSDPYQGSTGYAGFYTIDLPEPVLFAKGDCMSVVITFSNWTTVYTDKSGISSGYLSSGDAYKIESSNVTQAGQNFYSYGEKWYDAHGSGYNFRINALTVNKKGTVSHRVTFLDDERNILDTQDVENGKDAIPPQMPEKKGYIFTGWSDKYTNITSDKELTAQYQLTEYTIQYELDGGTNSDDNPDSYTIETETITLKEPQKESCFFAGWYLDADFSGKEIVSIDKGSTGNLIFYARWLGDNGEPVTPIFRPSAEKGATQAILEEGQTVTILSNKNAKIYYTLDGSNPTVQDGAEYHGPFPISENTTVKAISVLDEKQSAAAEISYQYYKMKLVLSETEVSIGRNESVQLEALQSPTAEDGTDTQQLQWESSNTNVAEVSETGMVTAKHGGNAVITATAKDYKGAEITAECMVAVEGGEYIAEGKTGNITWVIDANRKLTVEGTGDYSDPDYSARAPWYKYRKEIETASIRVSGMKYASFMFYGCVNLTSVDLSGFRTDNVVNMRGMFHDCGKLTSLDLSNFRTNNVTSMKGMFSGCCELVSLDFSNFCTDSVTDMSQMFLNCERLSSLDLDNFHTGNVTDMGSMFQGCRNLVELDLSGFNTRKATSMGSMFEGCYSLVNLNLNNFDTSNVTRMDGMFRSCEDLAYIDLSTFNTGNVERMGGMFYGCHSLTNLDLGNFDTANVIDMRQMFSTCYNLQSVNLSSFDTRNVRWMNSMFSFSSALEKLDLSNFDTANAETMDSMFSYCQSLECLDLGNFNTEKVTNMDSMFENCRSLTSLNVSSFNTGKVSSMWHMFSDCGSLASLDITNFSTGKVENAVSMFSGCRSLKTLDLSSFDFSAVADMNQMDLMLWHCDSLIRIYTPCNVVPSVELPAETGDVWYKADDTTLTELPRNLEYSILLAKNEMPVVSDTSISAQKAKTAYKCGEILNTDDLTVRFYDSDGSVKIITEFRTNAAEIDMSEPGTKELVVTYKNLTAKVALVVTVMEGQQGYYTVIFDLAGHGGGMSPYKDIPGGSLIAEPAIPVAEGWCFMGWYKDRACTRAWDFLMDTVQEDTTLYACWTAGTDKEGTLYIQDIPDPVYTGSAVKPSVLVYSANGRKLLKAGTDYTVKYFNNINAGNASLQGGSSRTGTEGDNGFTQKLAYITVSGKGNYQGTIYKNFRITRADIADKGFKMKYTEQLTLANKPQKPFVSMQYKKSMTLGKDYTVRLTDENGNVSGGGNINPAIPAKVNGTFRLTVTGIGNYDGTIEKEVYVADRNHLIKNVTVSLGNEMKSIQYTGKDITLRPAYYDAQFEWYRVTDEKGQTIGIRNDKNEVFTVKMGKTYLKHGIDYLLTYRDNKNIGTATATIKGINQYAGTKEFTFRITGTDFNAKNIWVDHSSFSVAMPYTGRALTQNGAVLYEGDKRLVYGFDYTVRYQNNVKKGTATAVFTARPDSGYSGSFKKTFKITAAKLPDAVTVSAADASLGEAIEYGQDGTIMFTAPVAYTKNGARISDRIQLKNKAGLILKEGVDYTVSYANNNAVTTQSTTKMPTMTVKGKGNYTGSMQIMFRIAKADISNLDTAGAAMKYAAGREDDYQYKPKVTIKDGKKTLSIGTGNKDCKVTYGNNSHREVTSYISALEKGTASPEELEKLRPYAMISVDNPDGCYKCDEEVKVYLEIYSRAFTKNSLYVVISDNPAQITYSGTQVTPEIAVYYGDAAAVRQARKDKTTIPEEYGLILLTPENYDISWGANVASGKNKGSVKITGKGLYGGSIIEKFTIFSKKI